MKIALKYGLSIAAGMIAWVIVAHILFPNPQSPVHRVGAFTIFNLLHFAGIYLGVRNLQRERRSKPTFKEGLKQGVAISLVYALAAALFFVIVLLLIGPKWMAGEPGAQQLPTWVVVAQSFAGLVVLTMIFGLVYSTLISFALARRLQEQ